jgi:hypothetical protein
VGKFAHDLALLQYWQTTKCNQGILLPSVSKTPPPPPVLNRYKQRWCSGECAAVTIMRLSHALGQDSDTYISSWRAVPACTCAAWKVAAMVGLTAAAADPGVALPASWAAARHPLCISRVSGVADATTRGEGGYTRCVRWGC